MTSLRLATGLDCNCWGSIVLLIERSKRGLKSAGNFEILITISVKCSSSILTAAICWCKNSRFAITFVHFQDVWARLYEYDDCKTFFSYNDSDYSTCTVMLI